MLQFNGRIKFFFLDILLSINVFTFLGFKFHWKSCCSVGTNRKAYLTFLNIAHYRSGIHKEFVPDASRISNKYLKNASLNCKYEPQVRRSLSCMLTFQPLLGHDVCRNIWLDNFLRQTFLSKVWKRHPGRPQSWGKQMTTFHHYELQPFVYFYLAFPAPAACWWCELDG